ncbi:MAG: cysteine--tRNA ligase [Alphaproteobacteria bacterium RIFCSPLOWO2_12_FULL_40_11]|nr:MAG: cysteine--tRNA ligase [Alphaproteobacteria bacterium RIFCSPLOWO2_12_FULL_40_11]
MIRLFNTLTHREEIISTIEPNHLKIYVCGPTVYDRPHLGNARSVVVYDLFFRFFRIVFSHVTYVRNITDVDDKINEAAKEQGVSIHEITQKNIEHFYADMDALNVMRPTYEPRATNHIAEMIVIIEKLIKNGHAYESAGHVLFDVESYKNYGTFSHRNLDEMIAGARVEIASYKKNPLDFVLWKPADSDDDISSIFDSPWGKGRPGWHIECSAMSSKYLGDDFDIHGGGVDLQFPHHENEIAQSRCANPKSHYAKFWIHNGFLTVNGEKMSKSLKNFITVRDLLDQGISGVVIRYFLLSTHYRKPLDFSNKALDDAKKAIGKFHEVLTNRHPELTNRHPELTNRHPELVSGSIAQPILDYLSDDLNIAKVIAALHEMAKEIKSGNEAIKENFAATLDFLGLLDANLLTKSQTNDVDKNHINSQIALRSKFKQEKNFSEADRIRDDLLKGGIMLEDVAGGGIIWKTSS